MYTYVIYIYIYILLLDIWYCIVQIKDRENTYQKHELTNRLPGGSGNRLLFVTLSPWMMVKHIYLHLKDQTCFVFGWIWDGSFVFCSCIADDFHMNKTSWTAISANTLSMKTRWMITGCHVFSPCNPVTHFWLADFSPSCPSNCIKLNHWTILNHIEPHDTISNLIKPDQLT